MSDHEDVPVAPSQLPPPRATRVRTEMPPAALTPEEQVIESITAGAEDWARLCPDADPTADVRRLEVILPLHPASRLQVVESIRAGLATHSAKRDNGTFRSLKNMMFLIFFYTRPAGMRAELRAWALRNVEAEEITAPPSGSKKQWANLIGYIGTARWEENLRFYLRHWASLQ